MAENQIKSMVYSRISQCNSYHHFNKTNSDIPLNQFGRLLFSHKPTGSGVPALHLPSATVDPLLGKWHRNSSNAGKTWASESCLCPPGLGNPGGLENWNIAKNYNREMDISAL